MQFFKIILLSCLCIIAAPLTAQAFSSIEEASQLDPEILKKKKRDLDAYIKAEAELAEDLDTDASKVKEKKLPKKKTEKKKDTETGESINDNRIKLDLEQQSTIERSYANTLKSSAFHFLENNDRPKKLSQYGYSLLQQKHLHEAPEKKSQSREYNDHFSLAPGDQILVSTYGSSDLTLKGRIDAQGDVFFEKVGVIHLKGLKFYEAKALITRKFQSYFLNSQVYIQLLNQAPRSVILMGQVQQPGLIRLTGQSSLLEVLMKSNGILKTGSLRRIEIRSKGGRKTIDLYDLILTGKAEATILTGGETIFIPHIGPTALIFGEVIEPGIYELLPNESLSNFMSYHPGLTSSAREDKINLYRNRKGSPYVDLKTLSIDSNEKLIGNDIIHLLPRQHLVGQLVTIKGAIHSPGSYEFSHDLNLEQLLHKAGQVTRLHGKNILIQRRLNHSHYLELYNQTQTRVDYRLLDVPFQAESLKAFLLQPGDIIEVPMINAEVQPSKVSIFGEIASPGEFPFMGDMNLLHLLTKAGGVTQTADTQNITISRPIDQHNIQQLHFPLGAKINETLRSTKLKAGDIVTVPKRESDGILVSCQGEFVRPGTYLLPKNSKLHDLIEIAGGLKSSAFTAGAAFYRKSVAKSFDEQILRLADQLEEDMIRSQKANTEAALESQERKNALIYEKQERLVQRLRESKSLGRIAIELPQDITHLTNHISNLELENGDRIEIPTQPGTVNIIGQVYNPNTLAYNPNLQLKDYLSATGGITKSADAQNIYVIKANGLIIPASKVTAGQRSGWITGRQKSTNLKSFIKPGDTVLVPEDFSIKPNRLQLTRDISQIMFQIIGSLGVVVAAF